MGTNSPDPAQDSTRFEWFLVVARNEAGTEGSWGVDSTTTERNGTGTGGSSGLSCASGKDTSNPCGSAFAAGGVYSEQEIGMDGVQRQLAPTLQNPAVLYYAWDHLGTVRLITNDDASLVERHDYEPYGLELPPYVNQSANTHQFTGHERDLTSGFDYMHFRCFGSTMGRFCKPDNISGKLANPQSWNKYSYVVGNPVNFNDPTGHDWAIFWYETNQTLAKFGKSAKSKNKKKHASDKAKEKVPKKAPDDPVKTALKQTGTMALSAVAATKPNPNSSALVGKLADAAQEKTGTFEGHQDARDSIKTLESGGLLLGSVHLATEGTAAVSAETATQTVIAAAGGTSETVATGFLGSGLTVGTGLALVSVAGIAGYGVGTVVDHRLSDTTKEIIGDTVLGMGQTLGLWKGLW